MSTENAKELGAFITRHRKAKGLTQPQLGDLVGLPDSTILRIERGEFKAPSPEKLQRIARALEIDFEDLFVLAGYATPEGLPGLPVYLREKYDDLSDEGVARVERYVEKLRKQHSGDGRAKHDR
jgi:transcriptional regulator with XRE-family HTH domain